MTHKYEPTVVPNDAPPGLRGWLARHMRQIADHLAAPLHADVLSAEPARPADGDIVYADGTNWNPGSGEGFYGRENGAWVKL